MKRLSSRILRILPIIWARSQSYLRGWRTAKKIVVIESDDWGAIRTSSRQAYEKLASAGYPMEKSPYSLDALETQEDLDKLFEVLSSVRDRDNHPACLTANMIMANPDFEQIRNSNFERYYYEPVAVTLSKSLSRSQVAHKWSQGQSNGFFLPQLHAREHIRWWQWIKALRKSSEEARITFDLEMCGVPYAVSKEQQSFYNPPYVNDEELIANEVDMDTMITEGSKLFEKQFGFKSVSTVAPNYCWTDHVEDIWSRIGIRYIQGSIFQDIRTSGGPKQYCHYFGERNRFDGYYMIRNCVFEPASERKDWVGSCLKEIARAFYFHKPAVICSHRVNFIGAINPDNRSNTLRQLRELLKSIVRRWPDVCFMSSNEMGTCMESDILSSKI